MIEKGGVAGTRGSLWDLAERESGGRDRSWLGGEGKDEDDDDSEMVTELVGWFHGLG